jgi:ABC-type amino acid transport substrate-binding protein
MRHRVALLALSLAFLTFAQAYGAQPVTAQTAVEPQHLTVATKEIEPFVFVDGHVVTGFSIELWDALPRKQTSPMNTRSSIP